MATGQTRKERQRRTAARAPQLGTALLHLNKWWTNEYQIANLSAGGALLVGGPRIRSGRKVRAVLRMHGVQPMGVDLRVVRAFDGESSSEDACAGIAVQFIDLEPALEDLIHDVVLAALSGRHLRPQSMHEAIDWVPLDPPTEAWLG